LIEKAREAEMETFKKHWVYEKVPLEERWRVTGKAPAGIYAMSAARSSARTRVNICSSGVLIEST
jgi:hypothetical protein